MCLFIQLLIFYIFIENAKLSKIDIGHLLQNENIRNTWPQSMLKHCLSPKIPPPEKGLNCFIHQLGYEQLFVEILNKNPPIIRFPLFLEENQLNKIVEKMEKSNNVESMGVEGLVYSKGYRGREADGLWLSHEEIEIRPLYQRLQKTLALNPALGEDFLILSYQTFGHYAPHFDHLEPMPVEYDDGWFAYFGNRLATALLIVQTAKGSFTTFPNLNLTIRPEKGDLLLWLNSNSNGIKEQNALHAACPITKGRKIAVSLWIRGNFQATESF